MKIWNEGTPYASTEYEFSDLVGKTVTAVHEQNDRITFETDDGVFALYHNQDCCESVYVESVTGDLSDLIGTPILVAEERTSHDNLEEDGYVYESQTWTFYTIRTIKGTVDIRWHGTSNGYYSERVDFVRM